MKVSELIAMLQKAPQDAFIDPYELDAVYMDEDLDKYIGSFDLETMKYEPSQD